MDGCVYKTLFLLFCIPALHYVHYGESGSNWLDDVHVVVSMTKQYCSTYVKNCSIRYVADALYLLTLDQKLLSFIDTSLRNEESRCLDFQLRNPCTLCFLHTTMSYLSVSHLSKFEDMFPDFSVDHGWSGDGLVISSNKSLHSW